MGNVKSLLLFADLCYPYASISKEFQARLFMSICKVRFFHWYISNKAKIFVPVMVMQTSCCCWLKELKDMEKRICLKVLILCPSDIAIKNTLENVYSICKCIYVGEASASAEIRSLLSEYLYRLDRYCCKVSIHIVAVDPSSGCTCVACRCI